MDMTLVIVCIALAGLLVALAIGRAWRTRDDSALPARSELSTLAFPPATPAQRRRR